jgi:hypothetical protein
MSRIDVVKTEVFKFEELTEEGKEKAIQNWREDTSEYFWQDENKAGLDEFESAFPISVKEWEYSPYSHSSTIFDLKVDGDIEELTGLRLAKWVINNHWSDLYSGKYYGKLIGVYPNAKHVKRHSKVIFDPALPTGHCIDADIRQPIYDFLKKPDGRNLCDIMEECLDAWISSGIADCEYQDSDEYIAETITANDYEFTADGKIY